MHSQTAQVRNHATMEGKVNALLSTTPLSTSPGACAVAERSFGQLTNATTIPNQIISCIRATATVRP